MPLMETDGGRPEVKRVGATGWQGNPRRDIGIV